MLFLKMLFWGLGHSYIVDYLPNMFGILGLIPSAQKQTDKKGFVAQNCSTVISGTLFKFWLPISAALLITLSSQISKGAFQTTARMLMSSSKYLLTACWLNCWRVEITQSRFPECQSNSRSREQKHQAVPEAIISRPQQWLWDGNGWKRPESVMWDK